MCARCGARSTLEWEERGDTTLMTAFVRTFLESVRWPGALGTRLCEVGHGAAAFGYAVFSSLVGLLPLSFVVTALLVLVADAHRLGLRSTSVLTIAVLSLLSPLAASVLFGLSLALWALLLWGAARSLGSRMRYDRLLRLSSYGTSLVALPLLGPLLLPVAVLMMLWTVFHALLPSLGGARAGLTLAASATPFGLLAWGAWALRAGR